MSHTQGYYKDGYRLVNFDTTKIRSALATMADVESPFSWQTKYPDTFDFRPSAVAYSDLFIEALIDNSVPRLLEESVNSSDMTLIHCQVRQAVYRDNYSYMPWHRDSYLDRTGTWVGSTPPAHKVIVYLTGGRQPEPRLSIIPGSHRRLFDQPDMDMAAYKQLGLADAQVQVNSSDVQALLFNTSLLHSVCPEVDAGGSVRVIYSFMTQRQFDNSKHAQIDIHRDIQQAYENAKGAATT